MTLIDNQQRIQATDPFSSFIVQAPAGSGKTEILTQRYLRLLSTVTAPEQIVALTFTRKAASEMRERIILALQHAANNNQAQSPHQQITLEFAHNALKRSEQLGWNLLQHANRLKVITIDSLCQSINQAIPLMEQQIAYTSISDKPETQYLKAARICVEFALNTPEYQAAIKTLLLHVDNQRSRLLNLFKDLLAQRDQWLELIFQAREYDKSSFEQALQLIEQHELSQFQNSLPVILAAELTRICRQLAEIENNPASPRYVLRNWHDFHNSTKEITAALSQLVLTGELNFRNSFDHYVGLKRGVCSDDVFEELKATSKDILQQLSGYPDFYNALIQVKSLPKPEYDPQQWQVLQALFQLLPILVGHLHLLFSEQNEVDFTAISQQALQALGDADQPTDLALYLDHSIHHLLVDEFQDTSITQFELLSKLVQGWQADDGKTLFLVGDPMQSIYRFRQAEVGLFYRVKEQGIADLKLGSLELRCNFRSTATIVSWVNQHFATIFPQHVDIESGAVSFHASVNVINGDERSSISAMQFSSKEQEASAMIDLIRDELQQDSKQSLAILVRSRSQLPAIIRLLRKHRIPYQGTDIDLLTNLMHLRDAWSLTQALLSPANRLAWLSLLRSPYCGLSLSDLHCIAQFAKHKSIYATLLQLDKITNLSDEGRTRADFFITVMRKALAQRYQTRLSEWVAETLVALKINNLLSQDELRDLEQLWTLLDRFEEQGRIADMKGFLSELKKLYSQQATPSRLQVMTIHKSKGLEFDTVFLPGLGTPIKNRDNPMLRWLKLPTKDSDNLLLISPIQAADQDNCPLYDYLSSIDKEKSNYESQRVLYVAATRAKSRLYLFDSSTKNAKNSFRSLLKHQEFIISENKHSAEEQSLPLPTLLRLPIDLYLTPQENASIFLNPPTLALSPGIPRLTGIVAHQLLHWICTHHPHSLEQIPWQFALNEFKKMGFNTATEQQALAGLKKQIEQLFHDPIGQWIIAPQEAEKNEYELLVKQQQRIVTRIIDRCFIDQDKLWIIDFKTGKDDEQSLAKHKDQLNEYGQYLSTRSEMPIHCGVYYLHNTHWEKWEYAAKNLNQQQQTPIDA